MTGRQSQRTTRCVPLSIWKVGKYLTVVVDQLVTLPRSPTVAEILHDFQEFVLSQKNPEYAVHANAVNGL